MRIQILILRFKGFTQIKSLRLCLWSSQWGHAGHAHRDNGKQPIPVMEKGSPILFFMLLLSNHLKAVCFANVFTSGPKCLLQRIYWHRDLRSAGESSQVHQQDILNCLLYATPFRMWWWYWLACKKKLRDVRKVFRDHLWKSRRSCNPK